MNRALHRTASAMTLAGMLLVILSTACSNGNSGPPSCSDAMAHTYGAQCTVTANGNAVSEQDAIDGCNTIQSSINSGCPCSSQLDALLECTNSIGMSECTTCSSQWQALSQCVAGSSNCST